MKKHVPEKIKYLIIICFIICIPFLVFIVETITPDRVESVLEATKLIKPFDDMSLNKIATGKFFSDFDTYVGQQLPARDRLIETYTEFNFLIGRRELNDIVCTEDGNYIEVNRRKNEKKILDEYVEKIINLANELSKKTYHS